MSQRTILLNPGPVTLSPAVRNALVKGDWCHREPEFADLTRSINARLARVYAADDSVYASVVMTSSGTGAVEAMLSTLAPRDTSALVIANGVYGERMAMMLAEMGRPHEVVRSDWMAPMDLDAVEARLRENGNISHVVAVHHETTTGRLNDIAALGALCATHGARLLLDSVSAFGAEEIRFDEWGIEALAGTANKCLHGVPGTSFVVGKRDALSRATSGCGSVYLNLNRYYATQHGDGFAPFTLAVQSMFALDAALAEFFSAGGWRARRARYAEIAGRVARHLADLGANPVLPEKDRSVTMASYWLPAGVEYQRLHDSLKQEGFVVYAGQGNLSGRLFRIAHMGSILDEDVSRLLVSLSKAVNQ